MFRSRRFLNVFKNDNTLDIGPVYYRQDIKSSTIMAPPLNSAYSTVKLSFHRSKTSKYFFFVHIHTHKRIGQRLITTGPRYTRVCVSLESLARAPPRKDISRQQILYEHAGTGSGINYCRPTL